jgi:hypothetical protein
LGKKENTNYLILNIMASTTFFLVMAIVAAILLLAASITAMIGAGSISSSRYFNSSSNAFTAHQHLIIAAALGWSDLVVLIVILIILAVTGSLKQIPVPNQLSTKSDLVKAYRSERQFESQHTIQTVALIVLIVVGIIALVIGIEGVVAAIAISNMRTRDSPAESAYAESIATAVLGFVAMAILIVVIITYIGIRSDRIQNLNKTQELINVGENRLGITTSQLTSMIQ